LVMKLGVKKCGIGLRGRLFGLEMIVVRSLLFLRRPPPVQAATCEGVPGSPYSKPTELFDMRPTNPN